MIFDKNEIISFDDVILVPQYSDIKSRSEIDTSVRLNNNIELQRCSVPHL